MAKRNAQGAGTIRKKTVTRKGKTYTYWEARYTVGTAPGTGKQIQISITGKTQKEVREKLQAATVRINDGTYAEPTHVTVGQWLNTWLAEYTGDLKPLSLSAHTSISKITSSLILVLLSFRYLMPYRFKRCIMIFNAGKTIA